MSLRQKLARVIGGDAFKRGEKQARAAGITPNEFNRATASAYFFYEGIQRTRERASIPFGVGDTKSVQSSWTRQEFMNVARYLYVNDGLTRGAINDLARYTVGTGIRPQSQAEGDWSDKAEDYWDAWCDRADLAGSHHFDHLQLLWNIAEPRDGDVGIVLTDDSGGDPRVQTVRGHRIGNFGRNADGLTDGVRANEFDQALAYRISTRGGEGWREIPARSFILYYEPTESDALRGITTLHSAITHMRDKKDTIGFEKSAIKALSSQAMVMTRKGGAVDAAEWNDDEVEAKEPTKITHEMMQGGTIPVIDEGESINAFEFDRPSPAFMGFLDFLIREIATGLGVPFEFVWNPEKIGGATMRFIMQKAQRRFAERQKNFERRVLRRIWGYVISNAIARGKLPDNPDKFRVEWQTPAELSVDAGRDSAQDREDVKFGLMSEAEHYGMRGRDFKINRDQIQREVTDLIKRAQDISRKTGVTFEVVMSLLKQSTPNGSPILNTAGANKKPEEKKQ